MKINKCKTGQTTKRPYRQLNVHIHTSSNIDSMNLNTSDIHHRDSSEVVGILHRQWWVHNLSKRT